MRSKVIIIAVFSILLFRGIAAWSSTHEAYKPCTEDSKKQQLRALELQKLKEADQADRHQNTLRPEAPFRDRERRERVGAIFGEGCFKNSEDYVAAALIYQHGDQLDHFF